MRRRVSKKKIIRRRRSLSNPRNFTSSSPSVVSLSQTLYPTILCQVSLSLATLQPNAPLVPSFSKSVFGLQSSRLYSRFFFVDANKFSWCSRSQNRNQNLSQNFSCRHSIRLVKNLPTILRYNIYLLTSSHFIISLDVSANAAFMMRVIDFYFLVINVINV